MTPISNADIARIARGVMDCSLPRSEWTHAAHFAVALWMLDNPSVDAFAEMPGFIRRYNEASGTPNSDHEGYHHTITLASLRAAKQALAEQLPSRSLSETLAGLLSAGFGDKDWLLKHWSRDRLFSVDARRRWLEPDLSALPF